ncbi:hypothetical protein O1L44_30145 [Streptomyces noursei]|nr:hypothetical protein [Streptomyces noursei]
MTGPVQILHTGQLLDLSRRLRAAGGPRLQRNFARRIRRAGEPLHSDLQSTVRGLVIRSEGRKANRQGRVPHGGPSPTTRPLRATIAAAIKISVRTSGRPGARIWVDRSLLPADLQKMPRALNDPRGRVRHPSSATAGAGPTSGSPAPVVGRHRQPPPRPHAQRGPADHRRRPPRPRIAKENSMIIQYTPADGEPQYFDAGRMRASEIQIVERTADGSWPVIKNAMSEGDIGAMRVVAWVIKRSTPPCGSPTSTRGTTSCGSGSTPRRPAPGPSSSTPSTPAPRTWPTPSTSCGTSPSTARRARRRSPT